MAALQRSTGQTSLYTNPVRTRHCRHFWEPADFASTIHRSGPSFSCKSDLILMCQYHSRKCMCSKREPMWRTCCLVTG